MPAKIFLAVDLGASSGRLLAGKLDGEILELSEVHRFGHAPVNINGRLYWQTFDLWSNILFGLREAHRSFGDEVVSVGVDAWGVDFALLDRQGELLAAPVTPGARPCIGDIALYRCVKQLAPSSSSACT